MIVFVVRRLLSLVLTAWLATVAVFVVLEVVPGDPALLMLGAEARPDTLAALRAELGLDRPAPVRYAAWVAGLAAGELGTSLTYHRPVAELVAERLVVTVPLALGALALSTVLALPLGLLAASRHERPGDWAVMAFGQLGVAVPSFWFAIVLILVFSVGLGWLPSGGFPGWRAGVGPAATALLLPAVALALPEAAILARVARAALLDTLREDFVRTARAKGLGHAAVMVRHVLPNALVPVATVLGLQFAFLVAGAVVVENVFQLPGLGRLVYQAVGQRDLVVVRDVVVLLAVFVVAVSALVDVAHAALDPRPRSRA
ncbi:ABC transporter permease [Azospirillum sp. ST 5-10]|uniref:ABC transporter permease n=1 Tax=unclassified Azospirillum TaxID=2630922 RepID=UPI003F49F514